MHSLQRWNSYRSLVRWFASGFCEVASLTFATSKCETCQSFVFWLSSWLQQGQLRNLLDQKWESFFPSLLTCCLGLSIKLKKNCAYFFLNLLKDFLTIAHSRCTSPLLVLLMLSFKIFNEFLPFFKVLASVLLALHKKTLVAVHGILENLVTILI